MNTKLITNTFATIDTHRLVFFGVDAAPPSPEHFTSPEKQSMEDKLNEVSAQTPSQIFNDTISAGSAVKTRYAQNTTVLAGLANDDPLSSNPMGGGGSATTTTGTSTGASGKTQNASDTITSTNSKQDNTESSKPS